MKKYFIPLLCMFLMIGGLAAEAKTKGEIKFQETLYDFGNIPENGGKVTHEFTFTNIGKEPLKITDARAECGCTTPVFPQKEIKPGESGVIKVTYNPLGRPGGFTKVVRVMTTGNPRKVNLKIRGTVLPNK